MNEPHFEVFPERHKREAHGKIDGVPPGPLTGAFVWHFKDANAHITFTGGESFTRREDAHRSIRGVFADVVALAGYHYGVTGKLLAEAALEKGALPIVDLDENGDIVGSRNAPEIALADHLADGGLIHLPRLAARAAGVSSSEGRRLLAGGALKLDGNVLAPDVLDLPADDLRGKLLQVGNRRFARLR